MPTACLFLTRRENQVLGAMCAGLRNHEIGPLLGIDTKTVSTYRERIFRKVGVKNNVQLGIWAERKGLAGAFDVPN